MLCLASLLQLWERLQVELHGQYSVARFEALVQYQARHSSHLRAVAIAIIGPLPLLLLIVSVDALPLVPISEGFHKQNLAFWLRTFLVGLLTPFTLIYQICIVAPALAMSTMRLCIITIFCAGCSCAVGIALALLIGFPVPFAIEFEAGPFFLILSMLLWISWKDTLRASALARLSLKKYLKVLAAQIVMFQLYIGFNLTFNQLHGFHQTMLSCLLPLIKLFFKNCINNGAFHLEDLSPAVVVFSVDIFHALFVSYTMQQASENGSNVVVMVVDVVQSCVAYYELSQVLNGIHAGADEDTKGASLTPHPTSQETIHSQRRSESSARLSVSVIDYAVYVLGTQEQVRSHPSIALPRHAREPDTPVAGFICLRRSRLQNASVSRVAPEVNIVPRSTGPVSRCLTDQAVSPRKLSQETLRHVECTKSVLKLLHMLEFYVLVEYVEAMLSVTYAVYILVLSYLPSRQFYTQLSHLSSPELRVTAMHVGVFAAAEVVSLVLFCVAVDRKVKHFSTLHQLVFALETNGKFLYGITIGLVFLIVQLSLEHFGSDYTFQFKWLREKPSPAS